MGSFGTFTGSHVMALVDCAQLMYKANLTLLPIATTNGTPKKVEHAQSSKADDIHFQSHEGVSFLLPLEARQWVADPPSRERMWVLGYD
jgi:hypothetical protein